MQHVLFGYEFVLADSRLLNPFRNSLIQGNWYLIYLSVLKNFIEFTLMNISYPFCLNFACSSFQTSQWTVICIVITSAVHLFYHIEVRSEHFTLKNE